MDKIVHLNDKKAGIGLLPVSASDAVYLTNVGALQAPIGNIPAGSDINGMTLTQMLNKAFGKEGSISFLHISDTHGYGYGINKCNELMDESPELFTIITGDLQLSDNMRTAILTSKHEILTMTGNHDLDNFGLDQTAARNSLVANLCGAKVNMPSEIGSYWYKDVHTNGATVRYIAFDEYEYTAVGKPYITYAVVYSEEQIRWFIDLLMTTPSSYYLVLLHHQPVSGLRDKSNTGLFISEHARGYYEQQGANDSETPEGGTNAHFIPLILDAYLNRGILNGTFPCGDINGHTMTLDYDFSGCSPCQFIAHIGGHTHWDCVEYLPLYPKQLQIQIDEDRPQKYYLSDLARSEEDDTAYCINKYTLDFDAKKIIIERIGAHITDGGADRNSIEFPFYYRE